MRGRALAGPIIARLAEHPDKQFADPPAWQAHLERLGIKGQLTENGETACGADQVSCETAAGFGSLRSCFCATRFAGRTARSTATGAS
jgi:hypothetical protein